MSKSKLARHGICLACAFLVFYISYKVACYLFLPHQPYVTIFSYTRILWATQDWFFRMLVVMNVIIKPAFIYYLVWLLLSFYSERKKRPSAKK